MILKYFKFNYDINRKILIFIFVFSMTVIYGIVRANYSVHDLKTILKSTRLLENVVSNGTNVTPVCDYDTFCYNKVGKKCFFLLSTKQRIHSFFHGLTTSKNCTYTCRTGFIPEDDSTQKSGNISYKPTFCNRFITIGAHMGRTGNQMFEIASLLGTAYKYDVIPLIPANYPINEYFDLPNLVNPETNKLSYVVKCMVNNFGVYYNCKKEMNTGKNVSMHGYLQSWKYFNEAYDVIKTVFKLKQKHLLNAKNFLSRVSLDGNKRVCIHIRRGDITSTFFQKEGYAIAGVDFVEMAKQFYRNKYSKVQFLVVSNDKIWCRKYIKEVNISTFTDPGDDLALMALSDDVVVTTGTFGWWGAWLSGGTTVYFNKYPRPGSSLASRMRHEDYYPPNWIGLS